MNHAELPWENLRIKTVQLEIRLRVTLSLLDFYD